MYPCPLHGPGDTDTGVGGSHWAGVAPARRERRAEVTSRRDWLCRRFRKHLPPPTLRHALCASRRRRSPATCRNTRVTGHTTRRAPPGSADTLDWCAEGRARFPGPLRAVVATLEPGDALYVPPFWLHTVLSTAATDRDTGTGTGTGAGADTDSGAGAGAGARAELSMSVNLFTDSPEMRVMDDLSNWRRFTDALGFLRPSSAPAIAATSLYMALLLRHVFAVFVL